MVIPKSAEIKGFTRKDAAQRFAERKIKEKYIVRVGKGDQYFVIYWKKGAK
jgi:hypothetical protein